MKRFSLVETPHKGIRKALSVLADLAGSTDYTNALQVKKLQTVTESVFTFLEEHAEIEEQILLPALESRMPELKLQDHDDHEQLELLQRQIQARVNALDLLENYPDDARSAGGFIYHRITKLQAAHLNHMLEEEHITQVQMWECFSDDELRQMQREAVKTFTPKSLLNTLQYILPALNPQERSLMVKGMTANAPAPLAAEIMNLAASVLSRDEFEQLEVAALQLC